MQIPAILETISHALHLCGAKAVIVGGSVRDNILNKQIKDYDIEVYGLSSIQELESLLRDYGSVNLVGKSFGVLKFSDGKEEYDFSFPRIEQKSGQGHQGFDIRVDGELSFKEASRRRDFTINAIGYDIQSQTIIDPYGGIEDIERKILRHIDDRRFVEDPLRVYRAVQFAARLGFDLHEKSAELCKTMVKDNELDTLPKERVYAEWKKLLLKAPKPSVGFELMRAWGITQRYFPELHALIGIPQDPKWHPEGDVWIHTMMALDAMQRELGRGGEGSEMDEKQKLKLMFAVLCHDFGKATTTTVESDKSIRATGHETAGLEPTRTFMYRLTDEHDFVQGLFPLVEHHLKPSQFYSQKAKAGAIRRLASKVNIEELVRVSKADFLGRTTPEALRGEYKAGEWLMHEATRLQVSQTPLKPLVQGRDLIALGLKPSPRFKEILDKIYDAQIEGEIESKEGAMELIRTMLDL